MKHNSASIRTLAVVIAPAFVIALAACGATTSSGITPAATAAAGSDAVAINLADMRVDMQTAFGAGKYVFTIANHGTVPHELLVFRTALAPDKYPLESTGGVAEDGAGITKISDGDNLNPGQSQTREVDLSHPGHYLFVCNLPGHFAAHMYAEVVVTSASCRATGQVPPTDLEQCRSTMVPRTSSTSGHGMMPGMTPGPGMVPRA